MPLPTPGEEETKDEFMGRCMGAMKDEKKPQDQKVAICFSKWEEHTKKMKASEEEAKKKKKPKMQKGY